MNRPWSGEGMIGKMFVVEDATKTMIGHCWMEGRLKNGDIAVIIAHSGDGFHTYCLVEHRFYFMKNNLDVPGIKLIEESKFGAYYVGRECNVQLSTKDFHSLMAGNMVEYHSDSI